MGNSDIDTADIMDRQATAVGDFCTSRRSVLRGLASLGVTTIGAGVLVGCSGDGDGAGGAAATSAPAAEPTAEPAAEPAAGDSGGNAAAGVPTSEIPVGEARVVDLAGQRVVVAQPTEGKFVGFSSRCTHQGTTVESVGGKVIRCPNHGSMYDGLTGEVTQGPATNPLPDFSVMVTDGQVVPA